MKKDFIKFAVAAVAALVFVPQVQAASVSVILDRSTIPAAFPDGGEYLRVTVSDGNNGDIDFRVETLFDFEGGGPESEVPLGIAAFGFNFGQSGATIQNVQGPDGWEIIGTPLVQPTARHTRWQNSLFEEGRTRLMRKLRHHGVLSMLKEEFGEGRRTRLKGFLRELKALTPIRAARADVLPASDINQFGQFDVTLLQAAGESMDPLVFSIVGVDGDTPEDYVAALSTGDAPRGNALFAAEVVGLDMRIYAGEEGRRVIESAAFGGSSVVPLPPSVALMLSATAVLGFTGLRRRKLLGGSR